MASSTTLLTAICASRRILRTSLPGLYILLLLQPAARADLIDLTAVADTGISENYRSNNLGAVLSVNAGTTQNNTKNRGLFRFDLTAIPPGSRIVDATLILSVTKAPSDGFAFADFGLHRVLVPWGEGTGMSPESGNNPGSGQLAKTNEATWDYRFALTTNTWTVPGGAASNDYVADLSSSQTIYSVGDSPYSFASSALMVADTQHWLDHPGENFGWMLICESEETAFTARRFGSREDEDYSPILDINYIPARIDLAEIIGGQINLHFLAVSGQGYTVEYTDQIGQSWMTLTNVPAQVSDTEAVVSDNAARPQRYYRLRLE